MFDHWKLYHNENNKLENLKCVIIPFDKFENFITSYLNIKMFQNKISWIYFKSSFGVSNKNYTREDLNSLIKNLTNDNEILKLFIQNEVETSYMNTVNSNKENYEINDNIKYNINWNHLSKIFDIIIL